MRGPSHSQATDEGCRYRAFLSYSHKDAHWAAWLHRKLESYRVPRRVRRTDGEYGSIPERLHPIFRDREELASSSALGDRLHEALADSRALVVVCSPSAARSRWVDAEIRNFRALGRGDRIHCLIVDGEPNSGDPRECFPPALRCMDDASPDDGGVVPEPIAADLRPGGDGRKLALLKLIAGLVGTDLDSLRQRDTQRHHRRMLMAITASLTGMVLAMGLAATAWIARNDAQRRQQQAQHLIVYMLGNLHDKLEKVGRLDLLDSLSDKAIEYLKHLNPRDLNDTTLQQLALAETQLGQVRLDQGRYADALARFRVAYERTHALAERHPHDSQLLFDRGQAEFWVGAVYMKSLQLDQAKVWFTRYRDSTREVYESDPRRTDWQHELAYGDYNLAEVDLGLGRLHEAEQGFASAQRILTELLARDPDNAELQFEVADEISWQGSVLEHQGDLTQAETNMARKVAMLKSIVAHHPGNPFWKLQLSTAQLQQAEVLLTLGRADSALALVDTTLDRMKALVTHDPGNKDWGAVYMHAFIMRAATLFSAGDLSGARAELARVLPRIHASRDMAARDRLVFRHIQYVRQLQLILALRAGDPVGARKADASLMTWQQPENAALPAEDIGRKASSEILAGRVDEVMGRGADARAHFDAALRLLAPLAKTSTYWRILDPWVRACVLTGRPEHAARARALLEGSGYVPWYPWPSSTTPAMVLDPAQTEPVSKQSSPQPTSRSPARSGAGRPISPPA